MLDISLPYVLQRERIMCIRINSLSLLFCLLYWSYNKARMLVLNITKKQTELNSIFVFGNYLYYFAGSEDSLYKVLSCLSFYFILSSFFLFIMYLFSVLPKSLITSILAILLIEEREKKGNKKKREKKKWIEKKRKKKRVIYISYSLN